jgi:hypothetical protein
MKGLKTFRAVAAAAAAMAMVACEQQSEVTGVREWQDFSPAALVVPTGSAFNVLVCKDTPPGSPAGTFDFTVSGLVNAVVPGATGNPFTLVDEECKIAATGTALASATITEAAEAGFVFDSVVAYRFLTSTGTQSRDRAETDPVITLTPFGNDVGWVVVYYNSPEPPQEEGCTRTLGYWKTHIEGKKFDDTWNSVGGPDAIFLHGLSYITVLNTPPQGDAWYILAHQYIAAILNQAAGANTSSITQTLADALALLTANPPGTLTDAERAEAIDLADTLDDYNNGLIGPGHCDEDVD